MNTAEHSSMCKRVSTKSGLAAHGSSSRARKPSLAVKSKYKGSAGRCYLVYSELGTVINVTMII